ncbi:MAG: hypothetical protein IJS03_06535 [Eubacterium sp.]|nr:hypothetical protein [Eubacterium sp.]
MTKKLGKKLLSIILSILMVVTTIPITAITASAYSTDVSGNLKARFFSTSNIWHDDVSGDNSALEWKSGDTNYDSADGMHDFSNNGYVRIKPGLNVTNSISSSTGMTISFAFRKDDNEWHRHILSMGSAEYSGSGNASSNSFYISGTTSWMANDGGYSDNSLFIGYVNGSGTQLLNVYPDYHFTIGRVYHCTINITTTAIDYYINGTKVNTLHHGDTYTTANLTAALNAIGGFNQNYFCTGRWGDGTFNGSLRNFCIYNKALTTQELTDAMAKDMMSDYEAMLSDTVYKNMSASYNAYVDLNEAWDAYTYGDSNVSQLLSACANLGASISNMTPWSPYTGTANVYLGTIATGGFSNVLYAPGEGTAGMSFSDGYSGVGYKDWATDKRTFFKGFAPSKIVLYYNGDLNNLYFPVGVEAYANTSDNSYRTIQWVDLNDDANLQVTRYWHGYQQGWNGTYGVHYVNTDTNTNGQDKNDGNLCSLGYSSSNTKAHTLSKDGDSKKRYWVNIARFKALNNGALNKSGLTFRLKITQDKGSNSNITSPGTSSISTNIYVVNYYQVTHAIDVLTDYFAHVNDYKEGGLASIMTACDTATSYNITSYFSSANDSNVGTCYTNAQDAATAAATAINNVSAPDEDNELQYIKLRNAMDYSGAPTSLAGSALDGQVFSVRDLIANNGQVTVGGQTKTLTGYNTFASAYTAAQNVMKALDNNGNHLDSSSNYDISQNAPKNAAEALLSAFNGLSLLELHKPGVSISNSLSGGQYYLGTNGTITLTNNDTVSGSSARVSTVYKVAVSTDGGSTYGDYSGYQTYSAAFAPFSGLTDETNVVKKYMVWSKYTPESGEPIYSDNGVEYIVNFLSHPTISCVNNTQLTASDTVTLTSTANSGGTMQYSYDNFAHYATYSATDGITPFGTANTDDIASDGVTNATATSLTLYVREQCDTQYSPVYSITLKKTPGAPTISSNVYLGDQVGTNTVTITANDGSDDTASTIKYKIDNSSWATYDNEHKPKPFDGQDFDTQGKKTVFAYSLRHEKQSTETSRTVRFLTRPYYQIGGTNYCTGSSDGAVVNINTEDAITIVPTTNSDDSGNKYTDGLEYSLDGGSTWVEYSEPFAPFNAVGEERTLINVKICQRSGTFSASHNGSTASYSAVRNLQIKEIPETPTLNVDHTYLGQSSSVGANGFTLTNTDAKGGCTLQYKIDNGDWQTYSEKVYPFGSQDQDTNNSKTIYVRATRNGISSVESAGTTVTFLVRPSFSVSDGTKLSASQSISLTANTTGYTSGLEYAIQIGGGSIVWHEYTDAFAPFDNTNATTVTVYTRQRYGGEFNSNVNAAASYSNVKSITVNRTPYAPNVSVIDGEYLDTTHGFTLSDADPLGGCTLQYKIDNGEWTEFTGSDPVLPFDKQGADTYASKTIYVRSIRNGVYSDDAEGVTVHFLSRPLIRNENNTANITANQAIGATEKIKASTTCNLLGHTYYSYNGTDWQQYDSYITPFGDNSTKASVTVYFKQVYGFSESAVRSVKIRKNEQFYVYSSTPVSAQNEYSKTEFKNSSTLFISTKDISDAITNYNYDDTVYYQVEVDGVLDNTYYTYDKTNGIRIDAGTNGGTQPDLTSAHAVTITAYLYSDQYFAYAKQTFVNTTNYTSDEVMHESFDNASISGTTLTFGNGKTATLRSNDAASIVDGAGYVDENGNSPDWRSKVLKINANGTAPGNYIQFTQNPLADNTVGTAEVAKAKGVTISFWRYLEKNGNCTNLDASGDPTGYPWRNAIAFDDGNETNGQGYYLIEVNGVNSICKTQGNDYMDYVQENQDPTGHAAGNNRGHWVNVVLTIDPDKGVTLYTNGEPHEMKANYPNKNGSSFSGKSDADCAKEILNLITSGSTNMYFDYGDRWEGNDFDLYLDDVRIYTGVKTQLDINNMYISDDADVKSEFTSTSHDPTNVTVYTLKHSVNYTADGMNPYDDEAEREVTLNAGTTVGQEVIDFCGLNPSPKGDDVSAVDEYSFGTGMTIYHKNAQGKWEVVGDDAGRCGYQNQKLFGGEYHTAIKDALDYAAEDSRTGAGHLVWAPHVMFNLYTGTWMYYGSTSSWGSAHSAIFVCDGAPQGSIEGPYTYRQIVYKSNGAPNAIDACVYYEYDKATNKPKTDKLYMAFGSWGGTTCIALKTLYADGDGNSYTTAFDGTYLCNGINSELEGASDGGSGEGAYIVYDNGYYYLYISYGQNRGSYLERVFRSENPTSGFVGYNGVGALDTSTHATHGGQILAPFELSNYDYLMVSTGHNSVYKTVDTDGDRITLNSAHARPYANNTVGWNALPDGALATRQSEVTGNVNMVNQVAYTKQGWPVLMPFQYKDGDKVAFDDGEITAADIEGVYGANDLKNTEYYDYAKEYVYTIVKDDTDPMLAYEYGTDDNGDAFKDYIVIERSATANSSGKYTYYARYYKDTDFDTTTKQPKGGATPLYEGVIGMHDGVAGISMICTDDYEYTWTYRISEIPHMEDVNSLGDSVSMDGVIYTHKINDSYAKYGRKISDDFLYGTSDLHQGERCTTITLEYPAKIDLSNPTAVYCTSDEEICKNGEYVGGEFSVVALRDNLWFDAEGNSYTDAQAVQRNGLGTGGEGDVLKRRYGLQGRVSDYYFDSDSGTFRQKGVSLIITYNDITDNTQHNEFEFCYVMANPAMAHTIQGIRNTHKDGSGYKDMRAGHILFDRFISSSGLATDIETKYVWNKRTSPTDEKHSTGTYKFLDTFGSAESKSANYQTPTETEKSFDDFNSNVGVNSGSYGLIEHNNDDETSYTVSSSVVDADYYVDYSNTDNYISNNPYGIITTDNTGKPTGYKFRFRTSNINWSKTMDKRWNATSYMLLQGELKSKVTADTTYNSTIDTYVAQSSSGNEGRYTYGNLTDAEITALNLPSGTDTNYFKLSGLGNTSTNSQKRDLSRFGNTENRYSLGLEHDGDEGGRRVMSGYYTDPATYNATYPNNDYYTAGLTRALPLIDTGNSDTNAWNMHIDFTGTQTVNKNTDPGSGDNRAERYANFIIEQGIGVFSYGVFDKYASTEETYAYYNIGVHTCDKGAARAFAENYLRKRLAVDVDPETKEVTVKTDANGAPIYLKKTGTDQSGKPIYEETNDVDEADIINPADYTIESYKNYIDKVAELNWFVENPTNTTFKDYAGSGSNASTEYVTAYTTVDGVSVPIYNTTKSGSKLVGSGTTNTDTVQAKLIQDVIDAYENLFEVTDYSTAQEDYVKIELLDGETETTTAADVDTIKFYPDVEHQEEPEVISKGDYTPDSWEEFVEFSMDIANAFKYDTTKPAKDKDSWRNVELTVEHYRQLQEIFENAEDSLIPAVDLDELNDTYNAKWGATSSAGAADGSVKGGVFTSNAKTVGGTSFGAGDQVYTYASWDSLKDNCINTYDTYLDDSVGNTDYPRRQKDTFDGDDITGGGESEADIEYIVGEYELTGVVKYEFGDVTYYAPHYGDTKSAVQLEVLDAADDLDSKHMTLVDIPAAYESFNSAKAVVDGLDFDMYTNDGQGLIRDASVSTNNSVYATSEEIAVYNEIVGASVTGTVKKTGLSETDAKTAELLSAVSTVNESKNNNGEYTYIKYFRIQFSAQFDDDSDDSSLPAGSTINNNQVIKAKYGEQLNLDLATIYPQDIDTSALDLDDYTVVNWSISMFDGVHSESALSGKPAASQKASSTNGRVLSKIANCNMAIVAELSKKNNVGTSNRYNIYDCYGSVIDVVYGDGYTLEDNNQKLTIEGVGEISYKKIPFYTFDGWTVRNEGNNVFSCKPSYNTSERFNISVTGSTEDIDNVSYEYDTKIIRDYDTSNGDFAAWAVKVNRGTNEVPNYKYQIASYNSTITFFVCANEEYIPIINTSSDDDNPNYQTIDGVTISADSIDGELTVLGNIDADDLVTNKIKNRAPFISLQNVTMKLTQARAFARVTQDANNSTSISVLYRQNSATDSQMKIGVSGTVRRNITSTLSTGQFTFTLNNKWSTAGDGHEAGDPKPFADSLTCITFRAFVNYDLEYVAHQTSSTSGDATATINATDYSNTMIAYKTV